MVKKNRIYFLRINMHKRLALLLNIVVFGGVYSLKADGEIKKLFTIGALAGLGYGGHHLQQMNEEYSRKNKKPDSQMRFAKIATAMGAILAVDVLTGETSTTNQHLAKVAVAGVAMLATTQPVADVLRPIPLVGGLLTDPVDEDGDERKDIGAIARFAIAYIPLRQAALSILSNSGSISTGPRRN
jgi:hypothetical protein